MQDQELKQSEPNQETINVDEFTLSCRQEWPNPRNTLDLCGENYTFGKQLRQFTFP